MNPNTMTLDECRDWLARDDGWVWRATELRTYPHWTDGDGNPCLDAEGYDAHPYPPTRDAAAAAMPEGWVWLRKYRDSDGALAWFAHPADFEVVVEIPDTGNEWIDRSRLAVASRMAAKKEPNRE